MFLSSDRYWRLPRCLCLNSARAGEGGVVFERAKFMVTFIGAYRRSRSDGGGHEAALQAAADDMLRQTRVNVPDTVYELWSDPSDELALDGGDWFGDGFLEITDAHLGLLRRARLTWDGAERGAPMLDPDRPYGRADLLAQLAEVFGTDDADELGRRHVEMYFVVARALRHATLAPGRYALTNVAPADVRIALRGYGELSGDDLGLDADGQVNLTEDHLRLLRGIEIRWPSEYECGDRLDGGRYPAAAADPKRPYGDFTFIEVDMARILGELPPAPQQGPAVFEPSPEQALRLQRLHWQMLGAMQVFLERAELAPGRYGLYPDHP